jgi:hypothetical protein
LPILTEIFLKNARKFFMTQSISFSTPITTVDYEIEWMKRNKKSEEDQQSGFQTGLSINLPPTCPLQIAEINPRLENNEIVSFVSKVDSFVKTTLQRKDGYLICNYKIIHDQRKTYIKELQSFNVSTENLKLLKEKRLALHTLRITMDQRIGQFTAAKKENILPFSSSSSSSSSMSPFLSKETQEPYSSSILEDMHDLIGLVKFFNPDRIEQAFTGLHSLQTRIYFEMTKQEMTICARVYFHYAKPSITSLPALHFAIDRTYVELALAGFRMALQEKSCAAAEDVFVPIFKAFAFEPRYLAFKEEAYKTLEDQGTEVDQLQTQIAKVALDKLVFYFKKKWGKHLGQLK